VINMDLRKKAQLLTEALPYTKQFKNKIVVIKFGGNALSEIEHVVEDVVLLKQVGIKPVVVHGGGPEIDKEFKKLKITPQFIGGLRYTNSKTIKIVENVFNKINNEIVYNIISHGSKSINATGYIRVKQKNPKLGLVGKITKIDKDTILKIIDSDFIPIISPIGIGDDGRSYNINADTTASHLAVSLKAEKFTILTDVEGVIINGRLLSHLNFNTAKKEIKKGTITAGMVPKVEACIYAVQNKCPKAHLLNGLTPHSILLEMFTDKGIGTDIVFENGFKKNN
tara:strand:+ start:1574 stop:2419 length:846 start_codon:yes stop_codon:yes gene_type:complete